MTGVLPISRYDTLLYDITLEATSSTTGITAPLTQGVVTAAVGLWPPSLATLLNQTSSSLTHVGNGRWLGEAASEDVGAALSGRGNGEPLAVIYVVNGVMVRYREAKVADILRVEAL